MASPARQRPSRAAITAAVEKAIFTQLKMPTVSPFPLRGEYKGDPNPGSQEFMRDKIDRAKEQAYGVAATEEDYAYWTSAMSASVDAGWSPYWEDRLEGWQAGENDTALYGKFAGAIPKIARITASRVGAAIANFAMSIPVTRSTPDSKGPISGDLMNALHGAINSATKYSDLGVSVTEDGGTNEYGSQADYDAAHSGDGDDSPVPTEYEQNTPRSWGTDELNRRVDEALSVSPHADDDRSYWVGTIQRASRGADWGYWVYTKMEVDTSHDLSEFT